jgi:hypothetical protein
MVLLKQEMCEVGIALPGHAVEKPITIDKGADSEHNEL